MRNGHAAVSPSAAQQAGFPREVPLVRIPLSAGTPRGFCDWFLSTPLPTGVRCSYLCDIVWLGSDEMDLHVDIPVTAFTPEGFRAWAASAKSITCLALPRTRRYSQ